MQEEGREMTIEEINKLLDDEVNAAICLRELLEPANGDVVHPPMNAKDEDYDPSKPGKKDLFPGGYAMTDVLQSGGGNVARVCMDSKQSVANRMEPIFKGDRYADLVPRGTICVGDGGTDIDVLDCPHRAADAVPRFSGMGDALDAAAVAMIHGNYRPLAEICPTSYVWGVDFRSGCGAAFGAILHGEVEAYDVVKRTARAQLSRDGQAERFKAIVGDAVKLSEIGLDTVPTSANGGVIVRGEIVRRITLCLTSVRYLQAIDDDGKIDKERTLALQRYILGLALVAMTWSPPPRLRAGCILVEVEGSLEMWVSRRRASKLPWTITHEAALAYAKDAAKKFGVGEDWSTTFSVSEATKDKADQKAERTARRRNGKKGAAK